MVNKHHYPRYILSRLQAAINDSPVVLIHGPRQSGKTTLARTMEASGYGYLNFDDPALVEQALADPVTFVRALPEQVILDEVQRVPQIFSALKMEVDRNRQPGRFILTGSANILMLPNLSDSLAGRMALLRLHPLAQAEIEGRESDLLARLFAGELTPSIEAAEGPVEKRRRLLMRITGGGYPAALTRSNPWRQIAWYRDYIEALVQRDVKDLKRIHGLEVLPDLLRIAAEQTARLVRINEMAAQLPRSRPTIDAYVTLLEGLFLVDQLPAWFSNRMKRLVKTPKVHLSDTGLACGMLGIDAVGLEGDPGFLGQIFASFIYQECRRLASWREEPIRFYHYRDRDGVEVDLLLERGDGAMVGLEAKTSRRVTSGDFKGLRKIASALGDRFRSGVVLYTGSSLLTFGEKMYAVPVSKLWS